MIEDIAGKRAFLKEVGDKLKSKYRGIDLQIDKIISQIENWFIFDEILYKPVVIVLIGASGVGKTSLIRDLVKLLNMYENFVEVDVTKTSSSTSRRSFFNDSVSALESGIYKTIKDGDQKGILLIDEIHKVKATDKYCDIWELLSDGKIGSGKSVINNIDSGIRYLKNFIEMYNDETAELQHKRINDIYTKGESDVAEDDITNGGRWNPMTQPISMRRRYIIDEFIDKISIKEFDELQPIFDYNNFSGVKTLYPFGYEYMLRNLYNSGRITIEQIFNIPGYIFLQPLITILESRRIRLMEKYNNFTSRDPDVLSKMLIFVAGNIDTLYSHEDLIKADADTLHDKTSNIELSDLKEEMLKIFKPEELARFGNNFVIYPYLNKEAYYKIIKDKLSEITNDVSETTGVTVKFSDMDVDTIFKVISPAQGARPAISMVYSIVNQHLPERIDFAISNELKVIDFTPITK